MSINLLPDRYKFLGKTFSGGLGEVLLCEDKQLKRKVAIKFLQDSKSPSLMEAEIRHLQGIRSKHVVEIFDLIKNAGSKKIGLVQE